MLFSEKSLKGKSVAVVGFGREGRYVVDFLLKSGCKIVVFDEGEVQKVKKFEDHGVEFVWGKIDSLLSYDLIVRSPGVSPLKSYLVEARENGIDITSQTGIFFNLCKGIIIGVTGSKGKGTTSTLIYEMLRNGGKNVHLAGNIGENMLDLLPKINKESYVVLELSSFQLMDVKMSPHIAVLLMVVPEHLDYHADFNEYIEAKRNILRFQSKDDFAVVNQDFPASNESDVLTDGTVYRVSREGRVESGCYVHDGAVWVNMNDIEDRLVEIKEIGLNGAHNLENVCAATIVARIVGVSDVDIVTVLRGFRGLEHRLELVREVGGVAYYNDSFSTIPETAIAAIEAFDSPKVLILGGSGKESDFSELGEVISRSNIRGIVGIGKEFSRIKEKIHDSRFMIQDLGNTVSMEEIVKVASSMAQEGDVVLLSPACASFDMFSDYKDRGNQFKKAVFGL